VGSLSYNLKFNLAVNYFEQNFMDKNCSINTVCNNLNISLSYLYTLFIKKSIFPHDLFLKQLRINEAKKKLCNTEASIGQIAKEVGFLNQFNFTRSFKNSLELSPENYRKIYKNK
jgi:AraC-like DNA-binding protein